MTVNTLNLRWISGGADEGCEVEVLVDGTNLIELVRNWEAEHTPEPKLAGQYAGLQESPADLLKAWLVPGEWKAHLLVCDGCLEWGCWPLQARIIREGERVIWSEFEQPHRRETWSYDGFGPFVFDAVQHDTEIGALLREVAG
ncbi:hypothetical protein V3W47_01570 [Deinococcus sp. YIM 134068]|uniref:hypothetical protein n=1 Tax=Deinococcus lichenicola TaxID=3118910 RepID=UPI002F94CA4B